MFRNLIDNIPKNTGLYSIGVMLLLLFHFSFELLQILLGLLVFLISYSSVYVFNDIFDVEEDMRDERKVKRKPIALGVVSKKNAAAIAVFLLSLGLLLSILLNLLFFCVLLSLIFINLIYSISSPSIRKQSLEDVRPSRLKHSNLGLTLIALMQLLKIFLPWTLIIQVMEFPVLFAVGFSIIYIILFKGYKEYLTIGQSVMQAPLLFGFATAFFISSMSLYPEPVIQASIVFYLFAGIVYFRNSHLTDRRVLLQSPVYILLGLIFLFIMISRAI
ncbi:MAG: UbiA family prenyltransferase [Candidatus Thorarchaeota archaeon]